MNSKYDKINTIQELLCEISLHGLSFAQEDINRAQDIIGHTPIDELIKLANDNGRVNDRGEPDPLGHWSSGKDGTQIHLYNLLFSVWNWERALQFYNEHSNLDLMRLRKENASLKEQFSSLKIAYDETCELSIKKSETILKLKAHLYDMMFPQEENRDAE